ncbi:hypothetical protein G6F68_021322 [Rhizopus microsporus]|nr:hypothetical protein G6F68_021322 [Rhizopus microsporus]
MASPQSAAKRPDRGCGQDDRPRGFRRQDHLQSVHPDRPRPRPGDSPTRLADAIADAGRTGCQRRLELPVLVRAGCRSFDAAPA